MASAGEGRGAGVRWWWWWWCHTLNGGSGSDTLVGGGDDDRLNGASHDDVLNGATGSDTLTGGAGADGLTGGGDADRFDFNLITESGPAAAGRDTINDFQQGLDRLDLLTIDADATIGGNQAFSFIGASAFSDPGQVRAIQAGGNTIVQVSNDGDTNPDMAFTLTGLFTLSDGDFLL